MQITKTTENDTLTMAVEGRLDAMTSAAFDAEVTGIPAEVRNLVFDFATLDFISSAGLRVIVNAYKTMKGRGGGVKIANANATVVNVLKLTGLSSILNIG